jgi:hypothetical protein
MDYIKVLKSTENKIKYSCEKCNYITTDKCNYNKHLFTAKHRRITNDTNENLEKYICNCGKEYKNRQGLYKHRKICTFNENTRKEIINSEPNTHVIMELINENKEFKSLIIEQQKENKVLINKLFEVSQQPSTINNNNNNTINNNQKFNLNFFLNDTCKDAMNINEFLETIKITFEELLTIGDSGFVSGVSDIFIKRLQDLDITKRPIHCTDLKRETIFLKDNDTWNKDKDNVKLKEIIEKVEYRNVDNLKNWCIENPDSKINNTSNNLLRDKIYLQTLQGDEKTREKIIKNISKEIIINKSEENA